MRKLIVLIALVGCGSSPVSITDFRTALINAECSAGVSCGLYADTADCVTTSAQFDISNDIAAVTAGKVTYDASAAGDCVDALSSVSCDQTALSARLEPTSCNNVFKGTAATGAACALGAECASGTCSLSCSGTAACCTGTCGPPAAAKGQPCSDTISCVSGTFCGATTMVCEALGASGSACVSNDECGDELSCVNPTGQAGTCQPLPGEGSACTGAVTGSCKEVGDVCNAQTMKCTKLGVVGGACSSDSDCAGLLMCGTTTGKCARLPTLGQPCSGGCSDGSFCQIVSGQSAGTCTAPQASGAMCNVNGECQSDYCDSTSMCATEPVCI